MNNLVRKTEISFEERDFYKALELALGGANSAYFVDYLRTGIVAEDLLDKHLQKRVFEIADEVYRKYINLIKDPRIENKGKFFMEFVNVHLQAEIIAIKKDFGKKKISLPSIDYVKGVGKELESKNKQLKG